MKDFQATMIADWTKPKSFPGTVHSLPVYIEDTTGHDDMLDYVRNELKKPEKDPTGRNPHEPGAKVDAGKNRGWLFFKGYARALKAVSEVTTQGAKKYTPNGWKTVPEGEDRYMDAFMRHLFDVAMDKKYDDGDGGIGTLHMAQVIWNLLSVLELQLEKEEQVSGK